MQSSLRTRRRCFSALNMGNHARKKRLLAELTDVLVLSEFDALLFSIERTLRDCSSWFWFGDDRSSKAEFSGAIDGIIATNLLNHIMRVMRHNQELLNGSLTDTLYFYRSIVNRFYTVFLLRYNIRLPLRHCMPVSLIAVLIREPG